MAVEMEDDLAAAVRTLGLRPTACRRLGAAPDPARPRAAFHLALESGGAIKVRRLESEAAARQQQALRQTLPPAFVPVLARLGPLLVEPWIEGQSPGVPEPALLRQAGGLLAAMHAVPQAGEWALPRSGTTVRWGTDTVARLGVLHAAGILTAGEAAALHAAVMADDPGEAPCGLVHHDFCGENMIVDRRGGLHVIDNEPTAVDAIGMDAARTWYRWELAGPAWGEFRQGYEAAGGRAAAFANARFWRICGVTVSAVIRLRSHDRRLAVPVGWLRRLLREEDDR